MKNNFVFYTWSGYHNFGDDVILSLTKKLRFTEDKNSDQLLITGGTLLPLFPDQKLFIKNRLDEKKFKKILVYGTGVNCMCKQKELEYTRNFLKDCKHIGLRDEASRKKLNMGTVIGDPFFHFYYPKYEKKDYVVINLGYNSGDVIGGSIAQLNYIIEVLKFAKEFIVGKLGLKLYPLLLHDIDAFLEKLFKNYIDEKDIYSVENRYNGLKIFGEAKFAITYKQHGMITCLCVNTPVIPLAYSQKTINVANEFGLETIPLDKVSVESLTAYYNKLKDFPFERIEEKIADYKKRFKVFVNEINNDKY